MDWDDSLTFWVVVICVSVVLLKAVVISSIG